MNKLKIEYFLNAMLYCIWRMNLYVFSVIEKIHNFLSWPINKLWISLSSYKQKRKAVIRQKNLHAYVKDVKSGMEIGQSKRDMYFIFFPYSALIPIQLMFFMFKIKLDHQLILILCTALGFITILYYYNLITKFIYSEDRYLYYFKIFETEDKRWYRKWKLITTAFILAGWIMLLMSALMF